VQKFEKAWGSSLSRKAGLTLTEMMEAAAEGSLKALYIMGENPMISDPDLNHLEPGLKKLDLLVVQDIFLHETGNLPTWSFPRLPGVKKTAHTPIPNGGCSASARR